MKKLFYPCLICILILLADGMTRPGLADEKASPNPTCTIKTSLGDIEVALFVQKAPKTVANFMGLAEGTKEFVDAKTGKKVKRPFYDGLIYHRVIKDFMIQGGCPLGTGGGGPGYRFEDEIDAVGLGLDKIKAVDNLGRPHPTLMIRNQKDYDRHLIVPLYNKLGIKSQEELDQRRPEVLRALTEQTVKDVLENMGYRYSAKGSPYPPKRGVLAMANAGPDTNGSQFFINLVDTKWLTGKHTVFGRVIRGMAIADKIGAVAVDLQGKPVETVVILSIRKN